jgi:hypothetical protein
MRMHTLDSLARSHPPGDNAQTCRHMMTSFVTRET